MGTTFQWVVVLQSRGKYSKSCWNFMKPGSQSATYVRIGISLIMFSLPLQSHNNPLDFFLSKIFTQFVFVWVTQKSDFDGENNTKIQKHPSESLAG